MKSTTAFAAVLVLVSGIGAYMAADGGFSDQAAARARPGSEAVVGVISEGEAVDLEAFARPHGRTVFFFKKPWCGACWRIAPRVEDAVRADPHALLRIIDIGSWDSAVAAQYRVGAVPHLILYEDGRRVASGMDVVLARLAR